MTELDVCAHILTVAVISEYADARLGAWEQAAVLGITAHANIRIMMIVIIVLLLLVLIVVLALFDVVFDQVLVCVFEKIFIIVLD